MAHVVAETCHDCKYTDCCVVCPVECFYQDDMMLYIDPADCIVFEDSPDGVQAGRHAGCTVVALTTTHRPADLERADGLVKDLSSVRVGRKNGRLHISLKGAA